MIRITERTRVRRNRSLIVVTMFGPKNYQVIIHTLKKFETSPLFHSTILRHTQYNIIQNDKYIDSNACNKKRNTEVLRLKKY